MKKVKSVDSFRERDCYTPRKKFTFLAEEDHETESSVQDIGLGHSRPNRETVIKWRANALLQKLTLSID